MDSMDMPLDLPTMAPDEPDDARWVPSQSSHPELQALIKQAERDKLSRPAIPCLAEPLWTHASSALWSSSTTPSTSRTPSLPLFVDTSSSSLSLDPSSSEPSSSSSSARRIKPYSAHVYRKPLSASANHIVHINRSSSKQELFSKRPRSSSHSIFDVAKDSGNAKGTKTLADREQDPDAVVFLALLRDVSKQLDENARKKQRVAAEKVKERGQMQSKGGQGGDQRSSILRHSGTVPKQDKGKGKEDPSVIQTSTGSKASNTWHSIDILQGHSGQSITDTTSRSRNLTRVSSMDPNVPSRQTPITDSRDLTRTSSSSTISLDPYRAETALLVVDLTLDDAKMTGVQESLRGVGGNASREHGTHAATSADESFMAVEPDINFGCSTDTDVDMDISNHRNALSRSEVDNAKPPSTTQQQLPIGQGRPVPSHRPQLGMRRPAVLSSNIQRNSPHPHPSQYSISSHVPKGTTVPRFKPPLLSTPVGQKTSAQKVSAEKTFTRPRVGGAVSGVRDIQDISRRQEGHARRQKEMSRSSSETDPDSSFDISFDLDIDVLEEAMRPYD